ncbi:hypothetical protein HMPREF1427_01122 [Helicobacter pylori GAM83Bi]|nr:hypothetical protein HMPREF1427_01122 [Helicobacter pylori GAM83Bi]
MLQSLPILQPLVNFLRGFYQATLKGWWLNQLFKTNSFNTASH